MNKHDPHVPHLETESTSPSSVKSVALDEHLGSSGCVIITTDHSSYNWARIKEKASPIGVTRNAMGKASAPVHKPT